MSAILSVDDLNDFISPGVACIKPVDVKKSNDDHIEIGFDDVEQTVEPLQISLNDCLLCSGCITSAEEVLVLQHSHKEFMNALQKGGKVFVLSISHQSRVSILEYYKLSIRQLDKLIMKLFMDKLGFKFIVGTGLGRRILLQQNSMELIDKKLKSNLDGPILSSACPGFILYAEKTHPELLPRISNIKTPQQITGLILKKLVSNELQMKENDIYHLSIMPCFDKKLELARDEVVKEDFKDVDCVITPRELLQMIMDENIDIPGMINELDDSDIYDAIAPQSWPNLRESWMNDEGSSSGGYALQYLINYRSYLTMNGMADLSITTIEGRNSDIVEYRLVNQDGDKLASSAIVNGFRNIQNIVRKLKNNGKRIRNKRNRDNEVTKIEQADLFKCDYVEIMACPSGCINGGGQISNTDKNWILNMINLYNSIPVTEQQNYQDWIKKFCDFYGINNDRMLLMNYNEIKNDNLPIALSIGTKW